MLTPQRATSSTAGTAIQSPVTGASDGSGSSHSSFHCGRLDSSFVEAAAQAASVASVRNVRTPRTPISSRGGTPRDVQRTTLTGPAVPQLNLQGLVDIVNNDQNLPAERYQLSPGRAGSWDRSILSTDRDGSRQDGDTTLRDTFTPRPKENFIFKAARWILAVFTSGAGPVLICWAYSGRDKDSFLSISVIIASKFTCAVLNITHAIQHDIRAGTGLERMCAIFHPRALYPWILCAAGYTLVDLFEIAACRQLGAPAVIVFSQAGLIIAAIILRVVFDLQQTRLQWCVLITLCLSIFAWQIALPSKAQRSVFWEGVSLTFSKVTLAVICGAVSPKVPVPYPVQCANVAILSGVFALMLWPVCAIFESWEGGLFTGWGTPSIVVFIFFAFRDCIAHLFVKDFSANAKNASNAMAVVVVYAVATKVLMLSEWSLTQAVLTAIVAMEVVHYSLSKSL